MKEFDVLLLTAILTCIGVFAGALSNKADKTQNKNYSIAAVVLCVAVLVVFCCLAKHFHWESTILSIPGADTPGTVAVNEETAESTVPVIPDTVKVSDETAESTVPVIPDVVKVSEETAESTAPVIPDAVKENEGDAAKGKIAATVQLSHDFSNDCPRFNEPVPYIYADQKTFEITWEQFEDHTTYLIYVCSLYDEIEDPLKPQRVIGTKYELDMSILQAGKKYYVNVATIGENGGGLNYSTPLYINMLP